MRLVPAHHNGTTRSATAMRLALSFLPGCILMMLVSLSERATVHAEFVRPAQFGHVLLQWHHALAFNEPLRSDEDLAEIMPWTGNV
jgi:hypothetical protein